MKKNTVEYKVSLEIDQDKIKNESSMIGSQNIADVKGEEVKLEKKVSIQINSNKNTSQLIYGRNNSEQTKSEILLSTANNKSVTKIIQPTKAQSITSQSKVVRHKIYQIKPMQMPSSSQSNSSNIQKVSKQVTKKQDVNQKEIKAISNVFGQFFKVENLRQYSKPSQTRKVNVQQGSQEQKIVVTKRESTTKIETKENQPKILCSQSIKSLSSPQIVQKNKDQIKAMIIKSPVKVEIAQQNKKQVQEIKRQEVSQEIENSCFMKKIENEDESLLQSLVNQNLQNFILEEQNWSKQQRYSQPHFKLLEKQQIPNDTINSNNNKVNNNRIEETKNNQPEINFLSKSQNFDNEIKVDKQPPIQMKQFINNNQFTHPLLQCQSRQSFPFIQPKQTLSQNATNSNLLGKQHQQIIDKNNKNKIQLKPMHSLGNLKQIKINTDYHNSQQEQVIYTPFFQQKVKDSQNVFDNTSHNNLNQVINEIIKKDQINSQDKNQNRLISPIKGQNKQYPNYFTNSSLLLQSPSQIESNLSVQQESNNMAKRQQKITNQKKFIKKQSKSSNIQRMFVKFNTQNKLMIDPLSYQIGFQSLQEVSSNLINQMEKQQQDNFINEIVNGLQQKWKQQFFNKKIKQINNDSPLKINIQVGLIDSPRKTNFQIKQPKPTQSCSPSKYHNFAQYEEQNQSQTDNKNNNYSQHQSILIRNKTPLKLPIFNQKRISPHIEQNFSDLHSFYQENQTPNSNTLPLQSAQKPCHNKQIRVSFGFNQSLTVEQQPQSILQSIQNQRSNLQQIQQIRQFYKYLRSRQSTYYGSNYNNNDHSPYHDNIPHLHQKEEEENTQNNQKSVKTYQNLHQIKETSKPIIIIPSARTNHLYTLSNDQSVANKVDNYISNKIQSTNNIPSISKLYSKEKKSLESIVLSFRRSNFIGDHKNFKQQVVSLSQSRLNNDHSDPHISFIQHPRQKLPLNKQLLSLKANHQSLIDLKEKLLSEEKHPIKEITFPLQKIQPVKVMSMKKSMKKNFIQHQNKEISKSPQNKDNPIVGKKIKVVSVNCAPIVSKPHELPSIIKPPQMSSFLFNSSHTGSFMLNNVIKSYIIDKHPINNISQQQKNIKQSDTIESKITKEQQKKLQQHLNTSNKKKIALKKNDSQSIKKLSINQKPLTSRQHFYEKTTRLQKNNDYKIKNESQLHKLNPQLKQTIQKINQHKQKQLQKLIRSRITQKENSRASSSQYNKSPLYNKFNDQSQILQNSSSTFNQFRFHSKQIYTSRMINNNNNDNISSSHKKHYHSNSKDRSLVKSRQSSKSSKKSGLQLWNSGLSELKTSRKLNGDNKIFDEQNTRQHDKIVGITKWNEKIAKYKQSRQRSNQSRLSSNKSKQKHKQNFFRQKIFSTNKDKQLTTNKDIQYKTNKEKQEQTQTNISNNNQLQQKAMNIEIKKYKYQVSNIQRMYL